MASNELLKGRCALITGGTSGIGFSIAEAFIKAGATVIITGRSQERIDTALSKLPKGKFFGIVLDNTKVDSFESKFSNILEMLKNSNIFQIDILVNNAGVNGKGMPNATEKEYDNILDTNLKGVFFLSQMIGKYFVRNNIKGNILNIASASSLRPADSAYSVAKWGIRGLSLGLAKALGKDGITVNGIAPGPTATPMMINNKELNMNLDRIPLGRYVMPEEIANMAVILVSDMGRSIMGELIFMTGGAANLTYDDVKYGF
ncbi:SDR family oxidoreductase [Bacteroides thetaiotaomicron]|jgi:short-chain dehydrogenase/reductase SDR|nr:MULTISPECIES: SDR family oxidoreductase [Bacteroides]MDC7980249.1 SDR family NAD(P)-dependent oxidoreductase [Bacteroides faecis]